MTPLTPFDQMSPDEQDALFDAMANDDSDDVAPRPARSGQSHLRLHAGHT
jgi:hypothetical protein